MGLDPANSDTDGNGTADGLEDHDGDQLANLLEVHLGTDPTQADSDMDGLSDGLEVLTYRSLPTINDTDSDGTLDDAQDRDGDGLLDLTEDQNGNYVVDAASPTGKSTLKPWI